MGRKKDSKNSKQYSFPNENYIERNPKEINKARADVGMSPIPHKFYRDCLNCEKEFLSFGPQNRLCYDCSKIKDYE